jgi:hypothetical protein
MTRTLAVAVDNSDSPVNFAVADDSQPTAAVVNGDEKLKGNRTEHPCTSCMLSPFVFSVFVLRFGDL